MFEEGWVFDGVSLARELELSIKRVFLKYSIWDVLIDIL